MRYRRLHPLAHDTRFLLLPRRHRPIPAVRVPASCEQESARLIGRSTADRVRDAAGASPRALRAEPTSTPALVTVGLRGPVAVGGGSELMGPVSPVFAR